MAIRARSKLCAAGNGVVEQPLDQPPGELVERCLLASVQAPQSTGAARQLLPPDPLTTGSERPGHRCEAKLLLADHGCGSGGVGVQAGEPEVDA